MKAKPQLSQSMEEEQIRAAVNKHWQASAIGDANAKYESLIFPPSFSIGPRTASKRSCGLAISLARASGE